MQSKKAFVMPWGSCSMLLFCLDSSSPQTKPKLRQVRALASRKWSGSWPRTSAPNTCLRTSTKCGSRATGTSCAWPGCALSSMPGPAWPASFLAMKPHAQACCHWAHPPTNITLVCVGWRHIGKPSFLWQAAILETFLIQTWLELSF